MSRPLPSYEPTSIKVIPTSVDEKKVKSIFPGSFWICAICRNVPCEPVCILNCPHLFCYSCIESFLVKNSVGKTQRQRERMPFSCPSCRGLFKICELILYNEWNASQRFMFNHIETKCDHCRWTGSIGDLRNHLRKHCPKRVVLCPNNNCDAAMPYDELIGSHWQSCWYYKVNCTKCSESYYESNQHECGMFL